MCGVPHQAVDHHIAKLVAAGRKVAICDQVEDPRAAQGAGPPGHHARRHPRHGPRPRVARSRTPRPTWRRSSRPGGETGASRSSISRPGASTPGAVPAPRVADALALFRPREILLPGGARASRRFRPPCRARGAAWWRGRRGAGPDRRPAGRGPCGRGRRARLRAPRCAPEASAHVGAPAAALVRPRGWGSTPRRSRRSSSSSPPTARRRAASSPCSTGRARPSARGRCARRWPIRPSTRSSSRRAGTPWRSSCAAPTRPKRCRRRSTASATSNAGSRGSPSGRRVPGRSRLSAPGLEGAPPIGRRRRRRALGRPLPIACRDDPGHGGLRRARSRRRSSPEPPVLASAGGAIRDGADAELDELRALRRDAQSALLAIEAEERRRSGISIGQGALQPRLRLLARGRQRAPRQGSRRLDPQAVAGQRRAVLHAGAQGARGEDPRRRGPHRRDRGAPLRERCSPSSRGAGDRVRRTAPAIGELDLFASFAEIARSGRWVRPRLSDDAAADDRRGAAPAGRAAAARGAVRSERHRSRRPSTGSSS